LRVSGKPVISFSTGPNGLLLLSFTLFAKTGTVIAEMNENLFIAEPRHLHDLQCDASGTRIKIWSPHEDVGLDLQFDRVTPDHLYQLSRQDGARVPKETQIKQTPFFERMAELHREMQDQGQAPPSPPKWWLKDLSEDQRKRFQTDDPVTVRTQLWAEENCIESDGLIPLLDFRGMHIFHNGKEITIKNGIVAGPLSLHHSSSFVEGSKMFDF
jgi:hypothetical protein